MQYAPTSGPNDRIATMIRCDDEWVDPNIPPLLFQRPCTVYGPAANPDKRLTMAPSSGRPQTNRSVFITP